MCNIGDKYNKLTILKIYPASKENGYKTKFLCICDCGKEIVVNKQSVISNHTKSCGCIKHIGIHKDSNSVLYKHWLCMKQRCDNPWNPSYKYYGGRGIKYHNDWKDYTMFKTWAENNNYEDGLSLERIDCNKDYTPDNCIWISKNEQGSNRRCILYFKYNNKIYSIKELAKLLDIPYSTLSSSYYNHGCSLAHYGCENSNYKDYINQ